jgi:hypothetical protein
MTLLRWPQGRVRRSRRLAVRRDVIQVGSLVLFSAEPLRMSRVYGKVGLKLEDKRHLEARGHCPGGRSDLDAKWEVTVARSAPGAETRRITSAATGIARCR